jgi:hypothetical protein
MPAPSKIMRPATALGSGWLVAVAIVPIGMASPSFAQPTGPAAPPVASAPAGITDRGVPADRSARRLFERFVEDAVVTTGGWIEGEYRYVNLPGGSLHRAGPLVAFKVVGDVEAGLRFAFLHDRPDAGSNESGLSDLDLYAKYRLPGGRSRSALGVLLKVPTADEQEGLGTGKSDAEVFGAFRADLEAVTLTANAGIRFNGRPDPPLPESEDSFLLGAGLLMPATARLTIVFEATYETERVEGGEDDARLTMGLQRLGPERRGGFRGAVGIPLIDGGVDYVVHFGAFLVY